MSRARQLFSFLRPTTTNREAYPAYARSVEEQYVQTLVTNTFHNTFYANEQTLLAEAEALHREMAASNPQFMAKALVFARNEGYMRLQPLFGLAILSAARSDLFAQVFLQVVRTPADLADFLTVLQGMGRGQGGRAIKRQVNRFLAGLTEYWAVKYNGRGRGYSLGDAIATAHPKPLDPKQQALFRYVRGLEADLTLLPQVEALERLKTAATEAEACHWIEAGKLPHEVVTGAVRPTEKIWETLIGQMPALALLRHLHALERAGVFENRYALDTVTARLTDRHALRKARVLPFRFAQAYRQVGNAQLRDALRDAVELTFDNLPDIEGQTAIFLDISGSMSGEYMQIGSVFALGLYKKTEGNSLFWLFDTEVIDAKPSRRDSILTQAERIKSYGGTDTAAPVRKLTAERRKVDQIVIITDEQQNSGSPFCEALVQYRSRVNASVKAFIVDIAPYRSAMVPPQDQGTYYIYGWGETVLSYIARTVKGYGTLMERIEAYAVDGGITG